LRPSLLMLLVALRLLRAVGVVSAVVRLTRTRRGVWRRRCATTTTLLRPGPLPPPPVLVAGAAAAAAVAAAAACREVTFTAVTRSVRAVRERPPHVPTTKPESSAVFESFPRRSCAASGPGAWEAAPCPPMRADVQVGLPAGSVNRGLSMRVPASLQPVSARGGEAGAGRVRSPALIDVVASTDFRWDLAVWFPRAFRTRLRASHAQPLTQSVQRGCSRHVSRGVRHES